MTAQEYVNGIDAPVLRYASQGAPAGQDVAILPGTWFLFELSDVEGEVKDGVFEATNLNVEGGLHGWQFSDWNHNYIYALWVRSDEVVWRDQTERWEQEG